MSLRIASALIFASLLAIGCVSQSQFLLNKQQLAIETAERRGQFEMNCPAANAMLLSSEVVQPAMQGPWVQGIQRAEYTIGVEGCGDRKTFVVICPEGGDGCFATGPGRFTNE